MTGGVLGGGVIFVVAAVLWAAVLVPAWMRRREFKAAELNAVRLQRTLRVLAETAEVPTEVRVEATAREALAQERLLRTAQRRQESERQAQLSAAKAEAVRAQIKAQQVERAQQNLQRSAKLQRPWVRRMRAATALLVVLAGIGMIVGLTLLIAGQSVMVLAASALAFLTVSAALVLMAPGRVKHVEIPAEHTAPLAVPKSVEANEAAPAAVESRDASAEHAASQAAAAARIMRARALARARAERIPAGEFATQPGSMLRAAAPDAVAATGKAAAAAAAKIAAATAVTATTGAAGADAATTATPANDSDDVASRAHSAIERSLRATSAAENSHRRDGAESIAERLRTMGVVGDTSDGKLELDEALRRHRNAS